MPAYVVRRLLSGLVMLFAITLITFAIFRLIPLPPGCLLVPCGPNTFTNDAQIRAAEHRLGADRPVPVQYAKFLWRIVRHGSFGSSWSGGSIDESLRGALPVTASILLGGVVFLLLLAIPLGALSALRSQTLVDRAVLALALCGVALHPFIVGLGLTKLFTQYLHLTPYGGYCHFLKPKPEPLPTKIPIGGIPPPCGGPLTWAHHLILPWLTFALLFLPLYTRMIRARFLETLGTQYVMAARGRGVSEVRLVRSHALRPALVPLVTMIGLDLGTALMACIYVETIYGLGGIGSLMLSALSGHAATFDLPLIAALFFVIAAFAILVTFLVDLAYAWLDPRVRVA
jgi:peptide/nickel transport system permease protein